MSVKLQNMPEVNIQSNANTIVLTIAKEAGMENDFTNILKELVELAIAHKSFEFNCDNAGEMIISVKGESDTTKPIEISVGEAAEILGISTQLVRRYCKEGKLTGTQTLGNSGKWTILVDEKITQSPKWARYKDRMTFQKESSKKVAETLLDIIEEKENGE